MPDIMSTGISGLLASQLALNTTSHNISNVNTAGYTRQMTMFGARLPERFGSSYIGSGVELIGVRRLYDQYLTGQVRDATSSQGRLVELTGMASRIDNLLADPNAGLQPALDAFFAGLGDLANHPSDTASRQALLGQANALTTRLHTLAGRLDSMGRETEQRIRDEVGQINSLSAGIAQMNVRIQQAEATGTSPNDLMDQRDELVRQLSSHVGINVVQQDGNQVNVFTGNGQTLVLGGNASELQAVPNAYDPTRFDIATSGGAVVTSQIGGGALGGLLDFRRDMLDPTRNALGRAAVALATTFNAQHREGMDLTGQLGGDFFNMATPTSLAHRNNAGTASIAASFGNVANLTSSDYTMRFDGTNWSATRSDGSAVTLTGSGTAADPFVADGLEFVVSGAAAAGDSFLIRPTQNAAAGLQVAITDPTRIAAASPLRGTAAGANTGTGVVGAFNVTDATDPNLLSPVNITFTGPNTYQINGAGSYTFTPGSPIAVNGWEMNLTGTPQPGDTFVVGANTSGAGDNTNALALAGIANLGVLDGGNSTIGNAYGQLVAQVGTSTQQAKNGLTAATALLNQSTQAQQNTSGVNLDEEAANLIRYQQSYQAAAQVINVASTLFDTLLVAVRGR